MVGLKINLRFGLLIFGVFENDVQNALHGGIEHLDIERAVVDCVNDLLVVCGVFAGHFKLHAGFKALYAVCGGRAPVAHHVAVKAPLVAENIGQQALVFSGERTVDTVIRAHNRPRLRVLYGSLKRRKVNFAQGAFINDAVVGHAVVFLTVGGEMLHADADILALHAIYVVFGRYGSSERYSKLRPPSGERLMLMAGPSRTERSSAWQAWPSTSPERRDSSRSNEHAMQEPVG